MHVMTPTAGALLACTALIACGGGDWESVKIEKQAPAASSVRLEGCVVDGAGRPAARAVQALRPDGQLAGTTVSAADGVFRVDVPARAVLRVESLGPSSDGITLMTGETSLSLGGCLRG
ncbi:carboxypeptidase regulatory-like domain-containing protein [Piscinibacter aquaticus]|uniref:Carboxypeptidase regulatory-like domain-containing protein n=1 Tax=Piscinibacter aquaticus TaxID=392597 RepID=A0A5C6U053_9BURK|nr:carboxypeptidase regulatory-like domain-containing protein [Piscinibacter aquaticus]